MAPWPVKMLGELAEVRSGYTFRGAVDSAAGSDRVPLLRIGDLTEEGNLSPRFSDTTLVCRTLTKRYLVREGDLVLANRGTRATAALIPGKLEAAASGQLFLIRIHSQSIAKEYLHWYINHCDVQKYLVSHMRGGRVKMLSIEVLRRGLRVPLPSLDVQRRIVEMQSLFRSECRLMERLSELKRVYYEKLLGQAAWGRGAAEGDSGATL